jgi:hypothetical protein
MEKIKITKTSSPKAKPDYNNLGFGKYFTDHMFLMDYSPDKAGMMPESSVRPSAARSRGNGASLRAGDL